LLSVASFSGGIPLSIFVGGFNQYEQEIVNPESPMHKFQPEIIFFAVRLEDISPAFHNDFSLPDEKQINHHHEEIINTIKQLIEAVNAHSKAKLIINNFSYPTFLANGVFEHQHPLGQPAVIDKLNKMLSALVQNYSDVFIFDLNYQLFLYGAERAYNQKMWFMARNPFQSGFIIQLALQYALYIKSLQKSRKKCLALDLDNTLWGGVIGEDGLNNIAIGQSYPGNVFQEIQRTIRQYGQQGVILALNSKNNLEDAKEVFEKHPDMILKWDDFSAMRVNWQDKARNMRELADELNIGLDSFVFIDDNPAEIEIVRQNFPEIETVLFTENPLENLKKIQKLDAFQSLSITESDRKKERQYREQAQRTQLKASASKLDDYYYSLNMKAGIKAGDSFSLKRLAQLTQKTNQFNLTTRRYSENEIKAFMQSDNCRVYYMRLTDRFGDNGITGLSIVNIEDNKWIIDTFLMSCRIIGRTAETALLSYIMEQAKKENVKTVIGEYLPTRKNGLVKDFYVNHGFEAKDDLWIQNPQQKSISCPAWIDIKNKL
ncbi:MAG: HAD-IIIC family phosphatase, partial [Calditrichales bacterium]|nr:HAD-IIIC family phosphatase [Calditrichales bacterium]